MSKNQDKTRDLIKRSVLEIQRLRAELATLKKSAQKQDVAIVGIACRLPGSANDLDSFWQLLREGRSGIADIPDKRWNVEQHFDSQEQPGKMYTNRGAFIDAVDSFDPQFFNITPREALDMDPQQRVLLEVSWRAFEQAGFSKESLAGSQTGVFVGLGEVDYAKRNMYSGDVNRINAYAKTGTLKSIGAGRLSFIFDLRGPSLNLDTACSSGLLAVHMACNSLVQGESELALAGAVNLMLAPDDTIGMCALKALSPTGECRIFDAGADGYVRGEGCAVVLLKLLDNARADGNNILAVIKGTAANNDGASAGLTAPNGLAQQAVINQALQNAQLSPGDIGFIETHGTGTALGDPIEVAALQEIFASSHDSDNPILLGGLKSNIGHLEFAAGLASLVKTVLVLQHGNVPPNRNFDNPSPYIKWDSIPFKVPTELTPWPHSGGEQQYAGISSFGMSGTNVHVIVGCGEQPKIATTKVGSRIFTLSARSEEALAALAQDYRNALAHNTDFDGVCYTSTVGRSQFEYRHGVVASSVSDICGSLEKLQQTIEAGHLPLAPRETPKLAFMFTGQGAQYGGMGLALYQRYSVFKQHIDRLEQLLKPLCGVGLRDILWGEQQSLINQTEYTQPVLFSFEYALAKLYTSFGIEPDVVIGHSVGEYVAACLAGVFSLADGLKMITARGRLMTQLCQPGGMLVVFSSANLVEKALASFDGGNLSIAAYNGFENIVVAGENETIESFKRYLAEKAIHEKPLVVSHAFHSHMMEPMLDAFAEVVRQVIFHQPTLPVISNVSGGLVEQELADPGYWVKHVREAVQFAQGINCAQDLGCEIFVEMGPKAVLTGMGKRCVDDDSLLWLNPLVPGDEGLASLDDSLVSLFLEGFELHWSAVECYRQAALAELPGHPLEKDKFWLPLLGADDYLSIADATVQIPFSAFATKIPKKVQQALQQDINDMVDDHQAGLYNDGNNLINQLCVEYIVKAFDELHLNWWPGQSLEFEEIVKRGQIVVEQHALLVTLLKALEQSHYLKSFEQGWELIKELKIESSLQTQQMPQIMAVESALLTRTGPFLAKILKGSIDPLQKMFFDDNFDSAARVYRDSLTARTYNKVLQSALDEVMKQKLGQEKVRILEIGAGTGGTTAYAVANLPPDGVSYTFTDVSSLFTEKAQHRLSKYEFMRFDTLDIEQNPAAQGYSLHSYDVIIAANVLHATADLPKTLSHVKSLLSSNGILILLELNEQQWWLDLTFGLLDGWWRFVDFRQQHAYPLLSCEQWQKLFESCGFIDSCALQHQGLGKQAVYIAQVAMAEHERLTGEVRIEDLKTRTRKKLVGRRRKSQTEGEAEVALLDAEFLANGRSAQRELVIDYLLKLTERLTGIDSENLDRDSVLLNLGIDSLIAMEFRNRINTSTGISMTMGQLLSGASLEGLAEHLVDNLDPQQVMDGNQLTRVEHDQYCLSYAQQRLWFLDLLEGSSATYNVAVALELGGKLDLDIFRRCVNAVVARHESLRTNFANVNGSPQLVIHPEMIIDVPVVDICQLDEQERRAQAELLVSQEARRPFNISNEPLIRSRLIKTSEQSHVWFINIHHIICDAWSLRIMYNEVSQTYNAEIRGDKVELSATYHQYGDFALWQSQRFEKEKYQRLLEAWRKRLDGAPRLLAFPTDKPRPAMQSYKGAETRFVMPRSLTEQLKVFSKNYGTTLFMTLLSGFKVLLYRYSGQQDVVVGTMNANRERSEFEDIIGFFANTVVTRTWLDEDMSFVDLLGVVQQNINSMQEIQDMPFDRLVHELHPERSLSYSPLFQASFVQTNRNADSLYLEGVNVEPFHVHTGTTKYDLTLFWVESSEGINGSIEYSTDLYLPATIDRVIENYFQLLTEVMANPRGRVCDIDILTKQERSLLLDEWAFAKHSETTENGCLHHLFERQVDKTPDKIALRYNGDSLSYRQLDEQANRLSHWLLGKGIGLESRVGICMNRSMDMVVCMLAIHKAGACYVPLDPVYPKSRLSFMFEDGDISLVCSTKAVMGEIFGDIDVEVLYLDEQSLDDQPSSRPAVNVSQQQLSYIIYTSGSTGKPKGVSLCHDNAVAMVNWAANTFSEEEIEGVLLATSICFDLSVYEIFLPLCHGGCAIVAQNVLHLADLPEKDMVTLINTVPSAIDSLLGHVEFSEKLKVVNLAGEPLSRALVDDIYQQLGVAKVYNLYGPSEDCTYSTVELVKRHDNNKPLIGQPISGCRSYILNDAFEPVPIGVIGELYLAGSGLARGYLGRFGATAERFIPNPFALESGERMYRTGDLVRYHSDGRIEYLERADHQVKVNGFRIELDEIMTHLDNHQKVKDNLVLVNVNDAGVKSLVAYVVPDAEQVISKEVEQEQVSNWQGIYDNTYEAREQTGDPLTNFSGWTNSYDGSDIPIEQMVEWAEQTCSRILRHGPQHILEIGCGTGLLLFRLAPHCQTVTGADFSKPALDYIHGNLGCLGDKGRDVTLMHCNAEDADAFSSLSPDTIVINSVAQYFPSLQYFMTIIDNAIGLLDKGGVLFLGDIRNYCSIETFYTAIEVHNAEADLSLEKLLQNVAQRASQETELVIHPEFFLALKTRYSQISEVLIEHKSGSFENELSKFRYDVTLTIDPEAQQREPLPSDIRWLDWQHEGFDIERLQLYIEEHKPDYIGIANIPNGKLINETAMIDVLAQQKVATVAQLRERMDAHIGELHGAVISQLEQLAGQLGYIAEFDVLATEDLSRFHVVLKTQQYQDNPYQGKAVDKAPPSWTIYANNPLLAKQHRLLLPELKTYLEQQLPEYMVPSVFMFLEAFPLLPNGKIDRHALPQVQTAYTSHRQSMQLAENAEQERLMAIFEEVLGVEGVQVDDNFFELGGHSLLAAQIISRIRDEFGFDTPIGQVFETPNIRALAAYVSERMNQADETKELIVVQQRPAHLPLSYSQKRMWFLEKLEGHSSMYNMPVVFAIKGQIDTEALERSLNNIVERHEILRTIYIEHEGQPVQVVLPDYHVELLVVGFTENEHDSGRVEQMIQQQITQEISSEFDLAAFPPIRAQLIHRDQQSHVLVITTHHIAADGWSLGIFFKEFCENYRANLEDANFHPEPLPLQYADYAIWQNSQDSQIKFKKQMAYWESELAGAPPLLQLPLDWPRPLVQTYDGQKHYFDIAPGLSENIEQFARGKQSTLFVALMAGFSVLLSRYAGCDELVLGSGVANRTVSEVEPLIGYFANTWALRCNTEAQRNFTEVLDQVHKKNLQAMENQDIPFDQVVETLRPTRDLSYSPLVQVMFIANNVPMQDFELEGARFEPMNFETKTARLDLILWVWQEQGGIHGLFEYNTNLFKPETIEQITENYIALLQNLIEQPEGSIATMPMASAQASDEDDDSIEEFEI